MKFGLKKVFLIERNLMPLENHAELIFERPRFMVFGLVANVLPDRVNSRVTHRKRAVTRLPLEVAMLLFLV